MEIELTVDDFPSAIVKGSLTNYEYQELNEMERPLSTEKGALLKAMGSVNKKILVQGNSKDLQHQMDSLNSRWSAYVNSMTQLEYQFVRANGNSAISADLMRGMINDKTISLDSAEIIYNKFPPAVKNSALGVKVKTIITGKRAVVLGNRAPVLNGLEINGKMVRSEDYIGKKYTLLDFWYAACPPCHEQFLYLNELYDKYGKTGLEMISISIDRDRVVWKKDITRSKIGRWKHMLAADDMIKEPGKQTSDRFAISGYPTILLIDKSGTIVYMETGGGTVEMKKLDELIQSAIGN
jgi:peroxiredoxin